jgi:hypothetical protein
MKLFSYSEYLTEISKIILKRHKCKFVNKLPR